METIKIFIYFISGSRCFFMQPQPQITDIQPIMAHVRICDAPKCVRTHRAGINDTIPINGKDSTVWAILLDIQE